jgi:hypothetical protein
MTRILKLDNFSLETGNSGLPEFLTCLVKSEGAGPVRVDFWCDLPHCITRDFLQNLPSWYVVYGQSNLGGG